MALLAALTLLCGCGKKEAQPQQEDMAVNIVPVEGVTALELCDGEVTLRFARTDDTWHWVDDGTFPLDQDAVAALLALPSSLAAAEPVQGQGELSGYGLETPKKYVTATADGADSTIYVGSQTSDGRWYVLTPDGVVRLAAQADGEALSRSIYDMAVLPELPAITEENLISLTLTGAEGKQVTFSVDESGVRRSGARDVTEKTALLVDELGKLAVTACVDYDPADGAAAVCGLDVPEAILAVNYVNAHGGDGALTLTVGGSTGDGGRYVTLNGDATIYRMEETGLAQVLTLAALGLS
ncbi:MAG: hypothetical protein BHW35_04795 [Firmicutes bacterium CAG:176_63_11]|nr:MAG: hypothetical protein BHW35_04795 [Firmicutes bacterium CAG:176_63_11]